MVYHNAIGPSSDELYGPADQGLTRKLNLQDLWPPIYRSRYIILAVMVAMLSLAIVATLLIEPRYRGTATVEIRQEAQKVLGTEEATEAGTSGVGEQIFLETQLDIIRSRSTALAVAQSLGLFNDPAFLAAVGIDDDATGGATSATRQQQVSAALRRNMSVSFSNETRIAAIEYTAPDPVLAARVANSFAENYIRLNLERKFDSSRYSLDFLRDQIREAQARLGNSERRALDYARSSRIVDAVGTAASGQADAQSLTNASLGQLNQALSEAVARRIIAEQKWAQTRGTAALDIPEVLSNPTIQQLLQQRAELRAQYQEQLERRTDAFPAVRQAAARLAELDRQVASLAGNVRDGVREEFDRTRAQEIALQRQIEGLKTSTLDEQSRGIRLSILRREASTNRAQLDALLTRYNQLNAQSGVQTNNLSIIDRAEVPDSSYWPNLPLNLALALVLGIVISAAYVVGRENLFEVIRAPDDVTNRLGLPVLGSIPVSEDTRRDMGDTKSDVSEALGAIRTSLALSSSVGVPRSVMFTSTQSGEGKSTACYGLALSLARTGRRVIVIDADLRRPNIHRLFDLKNDDGMSNLLAGSEALDQAIRRAVLPGVDAILAGPIPPNPAELLATDRMRSVVGKLEEMYDHVLIDSAPLLGLADAPLVASSSKAIIFVIESARTSVRGASKAVQRISETRTPVVGAVLSRFDPGREGYNYAYKYEYSYSYAAR